MLVNNHVHVFSVSNVLGKSATKPLTTDNFRHTINTYNVFKVDPNIHALNKYSTTVLMHTIFIHCEFNVFRYMVAQYVDERKSN